MTLSHQQEAAAHRTGQDVCVVAGPGSGKTRVLTERFAWLVTERGIAPDRVLAITFTEKAATEIKERLVKHFEHDFTVREQIERAYVSTIHAFCARLLRENSIAAAIDPEFRVLDAAQSAPLLNSTVDDVLEDLYRTEPETMRRFLRSLAVGTYRGSFLPDLAGSFVEIYETLRIGGASVAAVRTPPPSYEALAARLEEILAEILSDRPAARTPTQVEAHARVREWSAALTGANWSDVTPQLLGILGAKVPARSLVRGSAAQRHNAERQKLAAELRAILVTHYYAAERDLAASILERVDTLYRRRKRALSALDFDDLEEAAIGLLESHPEVRRRIQASFDFILMDELQDTNPLQWKLIRLVRSKDNFFAVGDANQSIYGFRHADPALFHGYRDSLRQAGLQIDPLHTNYRTRPQVLDAVNLAFQKAGGIEPHVLEAGSNFCGKDTPSVEVIVVPAEDADAGEAIECRWVARRIAELAGTLRITCKETSRPARFGDFAILTRANQSTGELQRALDEFGIPSIVLGGETFFDTREIRDLKMLLDVLVNPCNEVSLAGLLRSPMFGLTDEELLELCHRHKCLSEAVRHEPPRHWSTIEELRRKRNTTSPDRLLQRVIDESDYESGLNERARGNVEKFLSTLRGRYTRNPRPLAEIAAEIEDAAPESEAPPADYGDAVRLMTMHKAKGLEFPVVFLPYLHKGRSNDFPVLSYTAQYGLGIKWREPGGSGSLSDCIREANKAIDREARDAEENRLLYVGMTRAQEHLVLSWTYTERVRASCWAALLSTAFGLDLKSQAASTDHIRLHIAAGAPAPLEREQQAATAPSVPVLDRVASAELHESAISVTDVSRFLECPRKYFINRYLRWDTRPRTLREIEEEDLDEIADSIDASELGTQVHALLAGVPVDDPAPEALQLAERFRGSDLGRMVAAARHVEREWDFVMDVDGVVVRGQVDLWFEAGRDLVIVDYKTDRVKSPVDPASVRGYALQIQIYAEAIRRATGKPATRGLLHFLRTGDQVEVDVSPLARSAALGTVRDLVQAQQRLDFGQRKGEQCAGCDHVRGWCRDSESALLPA